MLINTRFYQHLWIKLWITRGYLKKMNPEIEQIWNQAKDLLKDEMSQISYKTWIEPLKIQSIFDNTVVLVSEDPFKRDMANSKFHDLIMNAFSYLLQKECSLSIICADNNMEKEENQENTLKETSYTNNNSYLRNFFK